MQANQFVTFSLTCTGIYNVALREWGAQGMQQPTAQKAPLPPPSRSPPLSAAELQCDEDTPGYPITGIGTYGNSIRVKVRCAKPAPACQLAASMLIVLVKLGANRGCMLYAAPRATIPEGDRQVAGHLVLPSNPQYAIAFNLEGDYSISCNVLCAYMPNVNGGAGRRLFRR